MCAQRFILRIPTEAEVAAIGRRTTAAVVTAAAADTAAMAGTRRVAVRPAFRNDA